MYAAGVCTAARVVIGLPALMVILIYKYWTRHLSKFDDIEGFLQDQSNLAPIRYSYSDIKKMTQGFREKLGQGGFGSVYKGKLRSGHDVAVKLLTNTKSNGQDFINEVATIGRIHHINVVKLIGYCAEKSTCALVYDFMPNGSLDKYISKQEKSRSLDWQRKYEIAVSVAKGIDYIHQGCDIKILHFDIKPHNILLDQDFNPKISDFGLAKFHSSKNSTVAITAIRGTIGYVAPELINRSIGKVSNKADVYSFGMLLMDMLGMKGTTDVDTNNSTQYFPDWIYGRLEKGKDVGDDEGNEGAGGLKKKMIIVALWCIQMSPEKRPSMREVVEMLEREEGVLQVPPQKCVASEVGENEDQTQSPVTSSDSSALLYGYECSTSFNM